MHPCREEGVVRRRRSFININVVERALLCPVIELKLLVGGKKEVPGKNNALEEALAKNSGAGLTSL